MLQGKVTFTRIRHCDRACAIERTIVSPVKSAINYSKGQHIVPLKNEIPFLNAL